MPGARSSIRRNLIATMVAIAFGVAAAPSRADDGYRVIHTFSSAPGFTGGVNPNRVVAHQTGSNSTTWALYGSTGDGIVYKLTPPVPGSTHWIETRLYARKPNSNIVDFNGPPGFDSSGAIYTISRFRSHGNTLSAVFRLTPPEPGQYFWTRTVLATSTSDQQEIIVDPSGHVFGLLYNSSIYELSPPVAGQQSWTQTVPYQFGASDGGFVRYSLLRGPSGELYGATVYGGHDDVGTIFRLSPPTNSGGAWTHKVLYSFPVGSSLARAPSYYAIPLQRDAAGNLYGSLARSTDNSYPGMVFKLTPPAAGPAEWTFTTLHLFNKQDGCLFPGRVDFLDGSGALYGGTEFSFPPGTDPFSNLLGGCIFKLSPPVVGQTAWSFTALHRFSGQANDAPNFGLTSDAAAVIYGTTFSGGATLSGTIFKLSP